MTSKQTPTLESLAASKLARARRRKIQLFLGIAAILLGALPCLAGFYYATTLFKQPEFQGETLSNIMMTCFFGGALVVFLGVVTLFALPRR